MSIRTCLAFLLSFSQVLYTLALPITSSLSTHAELHAKKSYFIDPSGNSPAKPWPGSSVDWCLVADDDSTELLNLMDQVWVMWVNAFDGSKGSSVSLNYAGLCKSDTGGNFLQITLTNDQYAVTSIGFQGAGFPVKNTMRFDMSSSWGTGNAVVNLAHEIGHAFGLAHEHQKPSAWKPNPVGGDDDPLLQFNCQNLKDYDKFKQAGNDMSLLCSSRIAAIAEGFSAVDILPFTALSYIQSLAFDWDSIMLYSSKAGAKTINGAIQPVLTRYDKSIILPNMKPSAGDGAAIQALYPPA